MDETLSESSSEDAESRASETITVRAERGNADAQFNLALKFAAGTEENFAQAANWYLKAAAQNHALAQYNLGVMYSHAQGMPRDELQSAKWMCKAAHLGDAGAQYAVGMSRQRLSLEQEPETACESRIEAYKWLHLAARQGYMNSEAGCNSVAMGMTREGVTEGNGRAAAFVPGAGKD
jgi:TPR repeat protein